MRKIPDSLIVLQEKQRKQTIALVNSAIAALSAEGYPITIKHLCERAGLSRSVFSKPHVKAVLDEARFSRPTAAAPDESVDIQYAKLLSKLERSERRVRDLKAANIQLRETVHELRSECELLRGELHLLTRQYGLHVLKGGERK